MIWRERSARAVIPCSDMGYSGQRLLAKSHLTPRRAFWIPAFAGMTLAESFGHLCLNIFLLLAVLTSFAPAAHAQAIGPIIPSGNWWHNCASLDLDFYHDQYYINKNTSCDGTTGTTYSGATYGANVNNFITGTGATFTRAGTNVTSVATPFYLVSPQSFISRASVSNNVTPTIAPFYTNASQSWISRSSNTTSITQASAPFYLTSAAQAFVSRASSATYFDSTGTLQTASTNTARNATYSYSGGTWVANTGTLIEPAATNGIRNNSMSGAAAGSVVTAQTISSITDSSGTATVTTGAAHGLAVGNIVTVSGASPSNYNGTFKVASIPTTTTFTYVMASDPGGNASIVGSYTAQTAGTLPTNWSYVQCQSGIACYVVATGTESGISFIDVRIVGTFSGAGTDYPGLAFETNTGIAAAAGQIWTLSWYAKLVSGTMPSSGIYPNMNCFISNGTLCSNHNGAGAAITTSALDTQQQSLTYTQPWTAESYVQPSNFFVVSSGQAIDVTFRTGMPQMEQNPEATTVIATSSAAVTRAADVYSEQTATYFDSTGTLQYATNATARNASYYYSGGSWITPAANALPPQTISSITDSSGTATVTTGVAHGLAAGNSVTLSGNYPSNYNGTFTIASVPSTTTFTYTMASDPGVSASQIGNYTTTATTPASLIEPASTNNIRNNTLAGAVVADKIERTNNGTFSTTAPNVCSGSATSSASGLSCSNGTAITAQTISSITYSTTTATLTTGAAHGLAVGNIVTISGVTGTSAADFNGTFMVTTVPSTTTFKYTMVATPTSAATVTGASYTATIGGWAGTVNGGTGTVTAASGSMTLTGDGTNSGTIYQAITTVVGNVYVFSVTVGSSNTVTVQAGTAINGATLQAATTAVAGATSLYEFKATTTTTYISVKNFSTTSATVSAVSFQSAGVFPTNWTWSQNDAGTAIYIYALNTQNGMPYIDFQILGTAQSGYTSTVAADSSTPAILGQTWTSSLYTMKVLGTSSIGFYLCYYATVGGGCPAGITVATHTNITSSRIYSTITPTNSTLTSMYDYISWGSSIGVATNAVFRMALPQREQSSWVTSPIPTSGSTAARSADVYNQEPASYFDNTGTLNFTPANTARDNHNATSPYADIGTLIEPSSTNYINNNMMVGAVASDTIERTNNGTFTTSCTGSTCSGWTTNLNSGTGSVSYTSGTATLTGDGTNAASIYQAIPTLSGYIYTIAVTTVAGNPVTVQAGTSAGGTTLLAASTAAASTTTNYQFTATGTPTYIQINNTSATAANVDTVSVQSAGHLPTNWNKFAGSGILFKVIGTGTELGINYVDVQYSGTSTATVNTGLSFQGSTSIAASQGQTWTESGYVKLTSGSFGSPTQGPEWVIQEYDSSGTYLAQSGVSNFSPIPTGSALPTQRYTRTYTTTNASTSYVGALFQAQYASGTAVNFTVRIGMPQLEKSSYVTSAIPTFGSAVTRSADVYNQPVGSYFNGSGVLTTAANNTPRMDHSPTSNYAPQGVLIEEQRTNLWPYSSATTGETQGGSGGTTYTTSSVLSPDGQTYFLKCTEGSSSGQVTCRWPNLAVTASTTYTASMFVEAAGANYFSFLVYDSNGSSSIATVNLANGTSVSCSTGLGGVTGIQNIGNGIYRVYISFTTGTSPTADYFDIRLSTTAPGCGTQGTGDGTSAIYVWGVQLEAGGFPTSYIPTIGTTVTRQPDAFTLPTAASGTNGAWYSQGVGTLGVSVNLPYTPSTTAAPPRLVSIDDGTTSNGIQFNTSASNGRIYFLVQSGGTSSYQNYLTLANQGIIKGASTFSSSGTNAAINGSLLGAISSTTIPTPLTEIDIGGAYAGGRQLNGWVNRVWYQPVYQANMNSLINYSQ